MDVVALRTLAKREFDQVVERAADALGLELYCWEDEQLLRGFSHGRPFQASIPLPSDRNCLGAIFLFGERLGTPLPFHFDTAPLGDLQSQSPRCSYPLSHPWPPADPARHAFPLTGSAFEYLVASAAGKPCLVLFVGDNTLYQDRPVLDQNWGLNRHRKDKCEGLDPQQRERWELAEGIPQRTWLRNFFRHITVDRATPVEIVSSAEAVTKAITRFLTEQLGLQQHTSPFRGLAAFGVRDHNVFYGRDAVRASLVRRITDRVKNCSEASRPFFRIVGPSGSGKSSLMQAGVIGRLCHPLCRDNWISYVFRPDELATVETGEPLSDVVPALFAGCLVAIDPDTDHARAASRLAQLPVEARARTAVTWLLEALQSRDAAALDNLEQKGPCRLIIGADQFEECLDALCVPLRAGPWEGLVTFLAEATLTGRIAVVYTMPLSRVRQIDEHQRLSTLQAPENIEEIDLPEAIGQIIDQSFHVAGLQLEPALRRLLLSDFATLKGRSRGDDQGTLLPLLSLAMTGIHDRWAAKMAARRAAAEFRAALRRGRTPREPDEPAPIDCETAKSSEIELLQLKDFEDLAQLRFVIEREGEAALAQVQEELRGMISEEDTVSGLLRQMVRFSQDYPGSFDLQTMAAPRDQALRVLVSALSARRLVVEAPNGRLRLVHEAVLHHWTRAAKWVEKERGRLDYIAGIRNEVRTWVNGGKSEAEIRELKAREKSEAAAVLYAWATTLSPVDAGQEVEPQSVQLREFLIAILAAQSTPRQRITTTASGGTHFHAAVAVNAVGLVRKFLGDDPECATLERILDKRTPVFDAALLDRTEVLELLLAAGATPDQVDKDGWQPLHLAAHWGHLRSLQLLLAWVPVNAAVGPGGVTVLHLVAAAGNAPAVALVLDHGAAIDACDSDGDSALYRAAAAGRVTSAKVLLDRGADPNSRNSNGWTPLHIAASIGDAEMVHALASRGAVTNPRSLNLWTPLHLAAKRGKEEAARALLEHGAPIDDVADNDLRHPEFRNREGLAVDQINKEWTALHVAAENGHTKLVSLLLEYGANGNAATGNGQTPLHIAVRKGHRDIVSKLLASPSIVVDARNADTHTPFQVAVRTSSLPIALLLARGGAQVDAPMWEALVHLEENWTALHLAAYEGKTERTQLLLASGANPDARTATGFSALHLAALKGQEAVAELLLTSNASRDARAELGETPLHLAASGGHVAIAELLVANAIGLNDADAAGFTPMHHAAAKGHAAMVAWLLDRRADLHRIDNSGWTPLHIAAQAGHVQVVDALIRGNADLNAVSHAPALTALQAAAETGQNAVVNALLAAGADTHAHTGERQEPLVLAIRNGQNETALRIADAMVERKALTPELAKLAMVALSARRQLQAGLRIPQSADEFRLSQLLTVA